MEIEENLKLKKCLKTISRSYYKLYTELFDLKMDDIMSIFGYTKDIINFGANCRTYQDLIDDINAFEFNIGYHVEILYF